MKVVIGIDLGGTKIAGILMDDKGRIIRKESRPTEAEKGKKTVIENIIRIIDSLKVDGVLGIGIAMPGFALPSERMTYIVHIPGLTRVKLRKEIEKKAGLPVIIENDANCFALAEQTRGAAKKFKNVIGVIIGTGVGSGIIIDGKIYRGALGGAGEIGHTKMLIGDQLKEVEDLISGPALIRKYNAIIGQNGQNITNLKEADKKSDTFKKVYSEFVFHTGIFFANIINTFNPECIVVGGGVSNIDFYKDVEKVVKRYAIPDMAKVCDITKNKLGADAGVIGAAQIILSRSENPVK